LRKTAATHRVADARLMNREALKRHGEDAARPLLVALSGQGCGAKASGRATHNESARFAWTCDSDAILLIVEQVGGVACHTGRERCFYRRLEGDQWVVVEPVLKDPDTIYGDG
jgi:phosphoribosyl-AMP cyclohydrolase